MRRSPLASIFAALLFALPGCSRPPAGPTDVTGSSQKYIVKGQYAPVALDEVDSLTIENGRLVIHGPSASQTVDLPAAADATKPDPHWALTTETDTGGKRALVFTQDESLDDFTIELPAGDVEMHYGILAGPNGADVMLLGWGDQSRCYWGYVTIAPKA
jgi:hypothetical protein